MSVRFATQLRSNGPALELDRPGPGTITFRVEAADLWDAARVLARPERPVAEVKARALEYFFPDQQYPTDFVLKFRGWEILDDNAMLADVGITDGSILLLAVRRRRPVR
ncbi:MAG TPA: ubiquitin-like domain-containing protein [Gemmatimonadaceae bacterium]|nr:ubiquitin-like domain-containing protein [Gemmatimonadaceae bacterium]